MKKIIGVIIVITLTILFCTGCKVSNTELANSLDGNMTRLVYSIGYLDSISSNEIQDLSVSSAYFANYNNYNTTTSSGANTYRASNYRGNVYNSSFNNDNYTPTYNQTSTNQNLNSNYCPTCNTLLNPQSAVNTISNSSIINEVEPISTGNATTNALGGLCTSCSNNLSATTQVNSAQNTISETTTSNYVDISLLISSAEDLNEILLNISQKRGIIMLYCTDLRSGNVALGDDDRAAINEYIVIIKETINYLNNNSTTLTAHMNNIKNFAGIENSQEVINAKLIRANEVLKTRYAKLDTCIDSLDAIITILQRNVGIDYTSRFLTNATAYNEASQTATTDLNNANVNNSISSNIATNNNSISSLSPSTTTTCNETITNNTDNNSTLNNTTPNYSNCIPDNTIANFNYPNCNDTNSCNNTNSNCYSHPTNQESLITTQTANNCIPLNCQTSTIIDETNNESILNEITASTNPHGIGIKSNDSALTGVPYNSTSVNTPKPGTLISAITLPANEVTNLQNNEPIIPETPIDNSLANTPMILPELEHDIPIMETPSTEAAPQIIKELGNKVVLINPIYDSSSNLKPLPFLPGV